MRFVDGCTIDLANFSRHGGRSDIVGADALIDDLRTHFGGSYYGNSATAGARNLMAALDLTPHGAARNTASGEGPHSHPMLIRRIHPGNDYARDHYELYAPEHGAFHYVDFDHMSAAVQRAYQSSLRGEGGIDRAAATWFAENTPVGRAAFAALSNSHDSLNEFSGGAGRRGRGARGRRGGLSSRLLSARSETGDRARGRQAAVSVPAIDEGARGFTPERRF